MILTRPDTSQAAPPEALAAIKLEGSQANYVTDCEYPEESPEWRAWMEGFTGPHTRIHDIRRELHFGK